MLQLFLRQQLKESHDPEEAAEIRASMVRIEALRLGQGAEAMGVVIDAEGRALVLTSLFKAEPSRPVSVVGPDGLDTTATLIGADYLRGISAIKLDKPTSPYTALSPAKPLAGELLMCLTGNQGAVGWISAAIPFGGAHREDHFPVFGCREHESAFLFNTSGQLTALALDPLAVTTGQLTPLALDPLAVPVAGIRSDLDSLLQHGSVPRRKLGLVYEPAALGNNLALHVTEVLPDSPAQKAGLLKGDYVISINGRPLNRATFVIEFGRANVSLELGIRRGDKDITVQLPPDKPEEPGSPHE